MADNFSKPPHGAKQSGASSCPPPSATRGTDGVAPLESHRLLVPGNVASLPLIRALVNSASEAGGFPMEAMLQIEMAVDEACTNIIEHAYRSHPPLKHEIEVVASLFADRLEIVINDYSPVDFPVSTSAPINPDEYLSAERHRGLGLYIINNFVDRVEHHFHSGQGNELRLVKFCA